MSSLLKVVEKPFQQQYGTPKLFELNVLKILMEPFVGTSETRQKHRQPVGRKRTTDMFWYIVPVFCCAP